jgi:hypothetical protein
VTGPFSRPALIALIAVAVASLAVTALLTILGDDLATKRSAGADGYSVSAIGHQGLVRLLEELDIPVVVSRADSGAKAKHGLLLVAEPVVNDDASRDRLRALATSAPTTLVVLPKWYASAERGAEWITDASWLPLDEVSPTLAALGLTDAAVVRPAATAPWRGRGEGVGPQIREPQLVATELLSAETFNPDDDSLLLGKGELEATTLYVLSDPDALNNYGLREPANARFTARLIDDLRAGGPVVIDETLHGYARQPSLMRALLSFPLALATLQVLICAVLIVWAAMVRFGPLRAAAPPISPGKDFLIRNTAALLHHGGHHAHALRRYLHLTVAEVRHVLHAPALPPAALTAWLERVRQARGGKVSLVELERAVESASTPPRVVEVAGQVFRWRMEMTHGTDSRS